MALGLYSSGNSFPLRWNPSRGISESACVPRQLFLPVWRQLFLPVHLLGLAPLLGRIGTKAGDVKLEDDGVMDHPVDGRGGGHGVGTPAVRVRRRLNGRPRTA